MYGQFPTVSLGRFSPHSTVHVKVEGPPVLCPLEPQLGGATVASRGLPEPRPQPMGISVCPPCGSCCCVLENPLVSLVIHKPR